MEHFVYRFNLSYSGCQTIWSHVHVHFSSQKDSQWDGWQHQSSGGWGNWGYQLSEQVAHCHVGLSDHFCSCHCLSFQQSKLFNEVGLLSYGIYWTLIMSGNLLASLMNKQKIWTMRKERRMVCYSNCCQWRLLPNWRLENNPHPSMSLFHQYRTPCS